MHYMNKHTKFSMLKFLLFIWSPNLAKLGIDNIFKSLDERSWKSARNCRREIPQSYWNSICQ